MNKSTSFFLILFTLLFAGYFIRALIGNNYIMMIFIPIAVLWCIVLEIKDSMERNKQLEFSGSIVNYYKSLIKIDSSQMETRSIEELKSVFFQYAEKILSKAYINSFLLWILIVLAFAVSYICMFYLIFPQIRVLRLLDETNPILYLFLTLVILPATCVLIFRVIRFRRIFNYFVEAFTNFKTIPINKVHLSLRQYINQEIPIWFYYGAYQNVECIFSIISINYNPDATTVFDTKYVYKLLTTINCEKFKTEIVNLLNQEPFCQLFSYNIEDNTIFLKSQKEVPSSVIKKTSSRYYSPFVSKDVSVIIFDMMMDVFQLINEVKSKG